MISKLNRLRHSVSFFHFRKKRKEKEKKKRKEREETSTKQAHRPTATVPLFTYTQKQHIKCPPPRYLMPQHNQGHRH